LRPAPIPLSRTLRPNLPFPRPPRLRSAPGVWRSSSARTQRPGTSAPCDPRARLVDAEGSGPAVKRVVSDPLLDTRAHHGSPDSQNRRASARRKVAGILRQSVPTLPPTWTFLFFGPAAPQPRAHPSLTSAMDAASSWAPPIPSPRRSGRSQGGSELPKATATEKPAWFQSRNQRERRPMSGERDFSSGSRAKAVFSEEIVDSPGQIGRSLSAMAPNAPCLPPNPLRARAFGGKGAEGMNRKRRWTERSEVNRRKTAERQPKGRVAEVARIRGGRLAAVAAVAAVALQRSDFGIQCFDAIPKRKHKLGDGPRIALGQFNQLLKCSSIC